MSQFPLRDSKSHFSSRRHQVSISSKRQQIPISSKRQQVPLFFLRIPLSKSLSVSLFEHTVSLSVVISCSKFLYFRSFLAASSRFNPSTLTSNYSAPQSKGSHQYLQQQTTVLSPSLPVTTCIVKAPIVFL